MMQRIVFLMGLSTMIAACGGEPEPPPSVTERARVQADPRAAQFLVEAQDAYDAGAYGAAFLLTDSAAYYAPELADVPFLRGRILTELSRLDEARAAYERVLALDSTYQGTYLNLGNLALRRAQHGPALAFFKRELARHPAPAVWLSAGRAYEQLRQPDSARLAYERAIAADTAYASAYLRLGQLLKDQGDLAGAIVASERGLRLDPDNLAYQYVVGALYLLAGRGEEAVPLLQNVVDRQPWHYWGHYNLGRALVQVGEAEAAERYLSRARALQASLSEIDHWRELAKNNPDQYMLWVKLSRALRDVGRDEEAAQADAVALTLAPHYLIHSLGTEAERAAHQVALNALVAKRSAEAAAQYEALLKAQPDAADVWVNLGVVYGASGRTEEAVAAWQAARRHRPDHPLAKIYLFQLAQPYISGKAP